jgi:hypothetical protein
MPEVGRLNYQYFNILFFAALNLSLLIILYTDEYEIPWIKRYREEKV